VCIYGGRGLWGAVLIALLSTASGVHAQGCEPWVARIISVQGPVVVERSGAPRAQAAGLDDTVCPGDRVRVGALGRAAVQLAQGDPADPLPRLGMGLAKIRDGDLDEGTREIETAAPLDFRFEDDGFKTWHRSAKPAQATSPPSIFPDGSTMI
jgi:hypothetical protein